MQNQKKVFTINLGNFGSTGAIIDIIRVEAATKGIDLIRAYPERANNYPVETNDYIICSDFWRKVNHKVSYYSGMQCAFSVFSTHRLIAYLKMTDPDLVHLHNIHGDFINLKMLFAYLNHSGKQVVWTLHDCWAFTGRCPMINMSGCTRWQTGCHNCVYPAKAYPEGMLDFSRHNWKVKRKAVTGLKNMVITTPSQWLAEKVRLSFLDSFPIEVIPNPVDISIYTPHHKPTLVKQEKKPVVLGVAYNWNLYKGIDIFIRLAREYSQKYNFIIVGNVPPDASACEGLTVLPNESSKQRLAEIYSSADVFLNPTREEVFGMTNIEALACGVPVITFNTGGSPECIDKSCGIVVERDDYEGIVNALDRICFEKCFSAQACIDRSKLFESHNIGKRYVELYERLK